MKKLLPSFFSAIALVLTFCCAASFAQAPLLLERDDWNPDVKRGLNDLIINYGKTSPNYDKNSYVVFDFDNTTAIFDVEEQLIVYQLQSMSFAMDPARLEEVLLTDLSDLNADLGSYGYFAKGTYADFFGDIVAAYKVLWEKYGPFTPAGMSETELKEIHKDPYWQEFATKMRLSYDLVCDVEEREVAYPWIVYWFSDMTEDELYQMSKRSYGTFGKVETSEVTWTSPAEIKSNIGQVSVKWTSGVSVSENLKELWRAFNANGIDVWVCSASATDAIRGAVDTNGLHEYCKGVVAMTMKLDDKGRYQPGYDYETGLGYYCLPNGEWKKMTRYEKTQTEGAGKSVSVINAIAPEYGNAGPLAGFGDSSGDFNFCTEFKSLKLAVTFNRANRKLTDGGAMLAAMALYEKEVLGYDSLAKANAAGDVYFLLQGRDENGARSLRPSSATLRVGKTEEKTFANEDNDKQFEFFKNEKISVKDALNTYSLKRSAEENAYGAKSGWLNEYLGYRSR